MIDPTILDIGRKVIYKDRIGRLDKIIEDEWLVLQLDGLRYLVYARPKNVEWLEPALHDQNNPQPPPLPQEDRLSSEMQAMPFEKFSDAVDEMNRNLMRAIGRLEKAIEIMESLHGTIPPNR